MRRAALALVLAACAKSAVSLGSFPCAADHTCPGGFECNTDDICVEHVPPPEADAATSLGVDTVGCSGAELPCDTGLQCLLDSCEAPCNRDTDCTTDRLCTQVDQPGTGACELKCTVAGNECPTGFSCAERPVGSQFLCVPTGTVLPACKSVSIGAVCTAQLCGKAGSYTVPCGTGSCVHDTVCQGGSSCSGCLAGMLVTCDGTKVTDAASQCPPGADGDPDCWCLTSNTPACTDDHFDYSGTCVCLDGTRPMFNCGDTTSCEQRCAK